MPLRRTAYLTLLVLALLTGLAGYFAAQLRFNYNFNDFYPAGDPDLDYYQGYTARFGNDNDYLSAAGPGSRAGPNGVFAGLSGAGR
jgi:predicted RND superfamily exporter protein